MDYTITRVVDRFGGLWADSQGNPIRQNTLIIGQGLDREIESVVFTQDFDTPELVFDWVLYAAATDTQPLSELLSGTITGARMHVAEQFYSPSGVLGYQRPLIMGIDDVTPDLNTDQISQATDITQFSVTIHFQSIAMTMLSVGKETAGEQLPR